jgi:DNA replication and repair protein RecF
MKISALGLHNFRNHELFNIEFPDGIVVIVGRNGLGKTNIVEAINYAATLSSHRVNNNEPLIQHSKESAEIHVLAHKHGRQAKVSVTLNRNHNNSVSLNSSPVRRPKDVIGVVQVVIFSPEDLELVKGDPAGRRKFIDTFMMLYSPRVADIKQDYDRALKQRNSLLKSAKRKPLTETALQTLEVWDEQLVSYGAQLVAQRLKGIKILKPFLHSFGDVISGSSEELDADYFSSWLTETSVEENEIAQDLDHALKARRADEVDRGITLSGPHRDDISLTLNNTPVKGYASHGQSWSVAIALKLATFQALREHDGDPVLILDDVFAELDAHRRERLANVISDVEQTIITVADLDDVPQGLQGTHIWLENSA